MNYCTEAITVNWNSSGFGMAVPYLCTSLMACGCSALVGDDGSPTRSSDASFARAIANTSSIWLTNDTLISSRMLAALLQVFAVLLWKYDAHDPCPVSGQHFLLHAADGQHPAP